MNNTYFSSDRQDKISESVLSAEVTGVKSLVQVFFPQNGRTLAYYNDMFDLKVGDSVFVEGSMEGIRGRVVSVSLNFRIRLSDYRRVICRADTDISGTFNAAGAYLISDDNTVMPYEKISTWYKPPVRDDDFVCGAGDDECFPVESVGSMPFEAKIAERGAEYFRELRVVYLEYSKGTVRAIVRGEKYYSVDFSYSDGMVSRMVCDCPYPLYCKHEFAAILQFRELLKKLVYNCEPDYFAAVSKYEFFENVILGKDSGTVSIQL